MEPFENAQVALERSNEHLLNIIDLAITREVIAGKTEYLHPMENISKARARFICDKYAERGFKTIINVKFITISWE